MIRTLADLEHDAIVDAIFQAPTKVQAARLLGIGKTTFFRKLKDLGKPLINRQLHQAAVLSAIPVQSNKSVQSPSLRRFLRLPSTKLEQQQANLTCPQCRAQLLQGE